VAGGASSSLTLTLEAAARVHGRVAFEGQSERPRSGQLHLDLEAHRAVAG
jgi:hypothetical protein